MFMNTYETGSIYFCHLLLTYPSCSMISVRETSFPVKAEKKWIFYFFSYVNDVVHLDLVFFYPFHLY